MCENKAVAILNKMQEGKTALIKKEGGEMLIAIVLDKPLSEAQALADDPDAFMLEINALVTHLNHKAAFSYSTTAALSATLASFCSGENLLDRTSASSAKCVSSVLAYVQANHVSNLSSVGSHFHSFC